MNEFSDTYFFSAEEAYKVASQQNKIERESQIQVCYYDGEKIESELANLIYLPFDNMLHDLATGRYRLPTAVNLDGLELSSTVKMGIMTNFNISLVEVRHYRNQYNKLYMENLQKAKLDFSEKLRFYLIANATTQVMQYVSKSIAKFLEDLGYDVFYDLYHGVEDIRCLKNISAYNPHVTININHFNNRYINDDCFNVVWFQDAMETLSDSVPLYIRPRDMVFSYAKLFTDLLLAKGMKKESIFKQELIPVNIKEFFDDPNITRDKQVVFVGSRYSRQQEEITEEIDADLKALLQEGKTFNHENIEAVFAKYKLQLLESEKQVALNYIQQSYTRNTVVEWACDKHEMELYGYNWDKSENDAIKKNFRGSISKENVNKLYNSARYVLAASGQVINTQRLGELVHSGAIPLIYDSRDLTHEEETWDDECLYFKTKSELEYILDNNIEPKVYKSDRMLDYFTYHSFINTILAEIKKGLSV